MARIQARNWVFLMEAGMLMAFPLPFVGVTLSSSCPIWGIMSGCMVHCLPCEVL
jgi:hypothetical protein